MRLKIILPLFVLLLNDCVPLAHAMREGTANANIMIQRYEKRGDFARAALWRETAAECLEIISIPMAEILIRYYARNGKDELAEPARRELADIQKQRQYHLKQAKADWEKAGPVAETALGAERGRIAKFIATWVPVYPDRFYEYGVYRAFFGAQIEKLKNARDYPAALNLEADAAEMCAEQYDRIPIAYFRAHAPERTAPYEKIRDAHRRRAALLRALARNNPVAWPPEADKVVPLDKGDLTPPKAETRLTPTQAIRIAGSGPRMKELLERHTGVHEYAWFQGFAWTVSYYNHGWGNLAIVLIDDKTGRVIDVLHSIDNLEAREWDEGANEREALRLTPEQVEAIVRKHEKIAAYLRSHPDVEFNPVFSERYGCWMVELIKENKEVGFVSVSDESGEALEVEIKE
jgi:hypothetical protein